MKNERHKSTRRSVSSRPSKKNKKRAEKPRIEVSAGGIVYKRTKRGVFFAMVKDSYGKWTFPKGHVRRGETYQDAAKREIAEEIGLTGLRYKTSLDRIDIWFRDRFVFKGKLIHKFIYYYLFEAPPHARVRKPDLKETGEKIYQVAWIPASEVVARSSYKDMQPILQKGLTYMSKRKILSE
jgi:8-oxo-dGTP pyrophosphatase MutT (NUDIX family)